MLDAARAAMKLPDTSLDPHGPVAFWGYASGGQASLFLTGPLKTIDDVEYTIEWVDWCNNRRLHGQLDYVSPEEHEAADYAQT